MTTLGRHGSIQVQAVAPSSQNGCPAARIDPKPQGLTLLIGLFAYVLRIKQP
jgi:hypothetical protein